MRVLIIDPEDKTVEEAEIKEGLTSLQSIVDGYIEVAYEFSNKDVIYVNEEGLFQFEDYFAIEGGHQPFAGKGVVVGTDDSGGEQNAKTELEWLKTQISFMHKIDLIRSRSFH